MQPYQLRVIEEKAALDEKCEKLEAFLVTEHIYRDGRYTPEVEMLSRQFVHMTEYSKVLGERIEAFN